MAASRKVYKEKLKEKPKLKPGRERGVLIKQTPKPKTPLRKSLKQKGQKDVGKAKKSLSIMDAAKKVVLEGGSPSLIKNEARMDRMDKLLGVIPSEKYKSGGRAKPKLAFKGGGRAYGKNS
tara:strand:+ start:277 stop:639 length:363 start_codon:yes stop_codon:yes gene_type:complete